MLAGAARVDITPAYTTDLTGFFARTQPSQGVADPVHARAAVFELEGVRLAIVSLDLLELPRSVAEDLRRSVAAQLATAPDYVWIACTHTHAAPAVYRLRECGTPSERFTDDLREHVLAAVAEAGARLRPVTLATATAPLHLGANRRAALRQDRGGPDGEQPADQTLRLLTARDERSRPILALLNYACHPVCHRPQNRLISSEYCGLACSQLEQGYPGSVFLFLNGCAGDINPRLEYQGDHPEALSAAALMVASARAALNEAGALLSEDILGARRSIISLHYEVPEEEKWRRRIDEIERQLRRMPDRDPRGDFGWMRAGQRYYADLITRARRGEYQQHAEVVVQYARVGPLEMLAFSGEVFFELGEFARAESARPHLWVTAYTGGGEGYIPRRLAYDEGGYEVEQAHWFYDRPSLIPGEGERLVTEAAAWVRAVDFARRKVIYGGGLETRTPRHPIAAARAGL